MLRPGGTAVIGLYHRDSWFYWLWTMLWRGVVALGLFRKGRRRLLSEIEYRSADNDALPLVKVYSRRQARSLFTGFATVSVRVRIASTPVTSRRRCSFCCRRCPPPGWSAGCASVAGTSWCARPKAASVKAP